MTISVNGTGITFNDASTMTTGARAARAFAQWNPQNSTLYTSYNVSSVSGYQVNFTTALPNSNYAVFSCTNNLYPPDPYNRFPTVASRTTSSFTFDNINGSPTYMSATVFST